MVYIYKHQNIDHQKDHLIYYNQGSLYQFAFANIKLFPIQSETMSSLIKVWSIQANKKNDDYLKSVCAELISILWYFNTCWKDRGLFHLFVFLSESFAKSILPNKCLELEQWGCVFKNKLGFLFPGICFWKYFT